MSGEERSGREPRAVCREYEYLQEEGEGEAAPPRPLRIRIPEVLDSQYGMYVWPCAPVLAQYIWFHRASMTGKRVLEVGAGVSLPGVVAAKCGAKVILSDSAALPQCLENCFRSCLQNNLIGVPVIGLTWGEISPDLLTLPPTDIILGSDVFYEPKDFEDVLITVRFIMERNPNAEFWTTYQVRSANWSIEALLHKWDLRCTNIPLMMFNADREELAGSRLPGRHSIQMMIITVKRDLLRYPGREDILQ